MAGGRVAVGSDAKMAFPRLEDNLYPPPEPVDLGNLVCIPHLIGYIGDKDRPAKQKELFPARVEPPVTILPLPQCPSALFGNLKWYGEGDKPHPELLRTADMYPAIQ